MPRVALKWELNASSAFYLLQPRRDLLLQLLNSLFDQDRVRLGWGDRPTYKANSDATVRHRLRSQAHSCVPI